jgi:multicomponent Na+:H+ antiporter subunit F
MIAHATAALVLLALLAAALAMVRIVRGPTHADRVVALDIFLAAAVALCVAASLQTGRTVFLDVAVGLALVGFVATIGWARLVERGADVPAAGGQDTDLPARSGAGGRQERPW